MKMSWEHFFFLLNGDERERAWQSQIICFSLETVNFELLALHQTAVHQEPADVLPLVALKARKS